MFSPISIDDFIKAHKKNNPKCKKETIINAQYLNSNNTGC